MRLHWLHALVLAVVPSLHLSAQHTTPKPQTVLVQGIVQQPNQLGKLRNVKITILKDSTQEIFAEVLSDKQGLFQVELPSETDFQLSAQKKHFLPLNSAFSTGTDSIQQIDLVMERRPGYVFDVTIANAQSTEANVAVIKGARIEVFNNTSGKEELVLNNYPHANFKFNFEKGNHYTLMIRRKGYLNKRIEAYIDVEGCILCFDGLGIVNPGVTDVMSHGNDMGTFLANIELEPLQINQTFEIENIYYDFNKWNIRPDAASELDKLIGVLKDNPAIIVEMGSHTDARGRNTYNLSLSQKRAKSAVDYLITQGIMDKRLTWKGYGESQLANECEDGVNCDEEGHQRNRRTELKIVGIQEEDPLDKKSLKDIIAREHILKDGPRRNEAQVDSKEKNTESKDKSQNQPD
ncbi:MAG: OmpA family protein [Bacteroidota bacterium]